jgi:hypothetical protein
MSRQDDHVCPFMKKTCIGCSVYRGRHSGLWSSEATPHSYRAPGYGNGSDWVASLDTFFKEMRFMEDGTPGCD